jgi:hypothetical protein
MDQHKSVCREGILLQGWHAIQMPNSVIIYNNLATNTFDMELYDVLFYFWHNDTFSKYEDQLNTLIVQPKYSTPLK